MKMRGILTAFLPAALLWLWSRSGAGVESVYAGGVYPVVGGALQAVTGPLPFSLFEVLVLSGALLVLVLGVRAVRLRRKLRFLRGLLMAAGWIVSAFLLAWGINYGRDPLRVQQGWHESRATTGPISRGEIRSLASRLCLNARYAYEDLPPAIASDEGSRMPYDRHELARIIDRGYASLDWLAYAPARDWESPSPKPVRVLFFPFSAAGMFSPWTSEAQYDAGLPDASLPFTVAHELAHIWAFNHLCALEDFAAIGWESISNEGRSGTRRAGASFPERPDLAPTDYATHSPQEDFAVSVELYLEDPEGFTRSNPRRGAWLAEHLFTPSGCPTEFICDYGELFSPTEFEKKEEVYGPEYDESYDEEDPVEGSKDIIR